MAVAYVPSRRRRIAVIGIRGSEKSMYGKLFEKLVLAGVLHVLGFQFVPGEPIGPAS